MQEDEIPRGTTSSTETILARKGLLLPKATNVMYTDEIHDFSIPSDHHFPQKCLTIGVTQVDCVLL